MFATGAFGLALFVTAQRAGAIGALAIDHNQGSGYGFAVNYGSRESAAREAVKQCGPGCRIVLYFWKGCGAYAADQMPGSPVYAWAVRREREAAQEIALEECGKRGGVRCAIRVWACEQ